MEYLNAREFQWCFCMRLHFLYKPMYPKMVASINTSTKNHGYAGKCLCMSLLNL